MPPLEVGIAFRCNEFIIMMADTKLYQSILTDSVEVEKLTSLDNRGLLMCMGSAGPLFSRHILTSLPLIGQGSSGPPPVARTAHIIGRTIQDIRHNTFQGNPLDLHLMLGTADETQGLKLYRGDPFGFLVEVPCAYIGVNGFVTVSIVDKYYRPDLTLQEAYSLLKQCVQHMKRRSIISYPRFTVKVLDRSGAISDLPDIKWAEIEI